MSLDLVRDMLMGDGIGYGEQFDACLELMSLFVSFSEFSRGVLFRVESTGNGLLVGGVVATIGLCIFPSA
jgi:hypothetical protein